MSVSRLVPALVLAVTATLTVGCGRATPPPPPASLVHDAYVWQRAWTAPVRAAVAAPPAAVAGLRVLVADRGADGAVAWPAVDAAALVAAHRPVTAVVRLDGARPPIGWSLAPVLDRVAAWRQAGVDVVGVEVDHDCATAALADYAAWLRASRPPGLRWSITALPTWASSPALRDVAAAVDQVVVQVHAVRAPALFERATARRWLDEVATAVPGTDLAVALPTYQVAVGGALLRAAPADVAGLVRDLERRPVPGLRAVVWFRLPVAGDDTAWSGPTLAAVISGAPLTARVEARLVSRGRGRHDLVLRNTGTVDGAWPTLRLSGSLTAADLVAGYAVAADGTWTPPRRTLAVGAETVVGWATGEELRLDAL